MNNTLKLNKDEYYAFLSNLNLILVKDHKIYWKMGYFAKENNPMYELYITDVFDKVYRLCEKNANGKDYYGFIRQTSCPAVIVECAFVDNVTDLQILATEDKKREMGVAIAKGVLKTLGVAYQSERGTLYRVQVGAYSVKANAEAMLAKLKKAGFDGFISSSK